MKKWLTAALAAAFVAVAAFLGGVGTASAQTSTQQVQQHLDAAAPLCQGTNFNTINTQSVCTITAPAGQYVYITRIELEACEDATGTAATNVNFTSTGLGSINPSWSLSMPLSAGLCSFREINFTTTLKSQTPGTNVVLTSPSALTHTGFGIKAYGYFYGS
jgi:hypothetical protein